MKTWEITVYETVTQRVVYSVTADTEEEARDSAESGESDEEHDRKDVEVTNRHVLLVKEGVPACEHEVAQRSIVYAEDTDWIVDVRCIKCGVIGSALVDPKSVQW
jgi:hypothetical protein